MPRWNDDDAFWEIMGDEIFSPALLDAAQLEVPQLLRMLQLRPPARVLDLCCGQGRHSVELARRGFSVTGVDRTRSYLERARKRAIDAGVRVEFIQEDARAFEQFGTFDAVLNLYTSFGYFESREEELAVLRHVHASLRPGGQLLMDVNGKEVMARMFTPSVAGELHDGSLFVELRSVRPGWEWIDSRWILIRGKERIEHHVSIRTYSGAELTALLHEAGFADVDLFGSFVGTPYDTTAQRLIVRAQKAPREPEKRRAVK